jgi:hypothetical protein
MSPRLANLAAPCPECGGTAPDLFHSSCRLRSAWSPAERARFDREDSRAEALEMAALAIPLPDPDTEAPRVRVRRRIDDLTGRRFGRLKVEGPCVRERADGRIGRDWVVRCDCGRQVKMRTSTLRRGARACHPCAAVAAGSARAKIPAAQVVELRELRAKGWTFRQLAARFGLSAAGALNIATGRYRRSAA